MMTTVNPKEISHFRQDSGRWWDETGPFAILHRINPLRMAYIRRQITAHFANKSEDTHKSKDERKPFSGLDIVDIGCGGGLVCEPAARLGANVTGLDADEQAIATAAAHAEASGLTIDYHATSAEQFIRDHNQQFDVVLALEILEHVADMNIFIQSCQALCKPDGIIIFSTLNRTPRSFLFGIVGAEYITRWVPRGTHNWKQFVRPSELRAVLRDCDLTPVDITGLQYKPLQDEFHLGSDVSVNYFLTAKKQT